MKTVIIYKESLLAISETFIAEPVRALKTFKPKYLGLTRSVPSFAFQGEPLLLTNGHGPLSRFRVRLYRRFPVAPLFHARARRLHGDLIHAHFAPDGVQATTIAKELRLPLIVSLWGHDVTARRDWAAAYSKLWDGADLYLCVSEFIREQAIQIGFPKEKLRVHYGGIDVSKFSPPTDPRTPGLVLFVGRLVEKKGCEVLLRATDIVRKAVPGMSLAILGDGPLRADLEKLSSSLNLPCKFLGSLPPAEVQAWMKKAVIFCAPSQVASSGDCEGLGMVFLEAQACGLPVVSTLHGGIPEAVKQGETGLLVPEGDSQALAQALITYLSDPELAARHGAAGRTRVASSFDLFKQTPLLEKVYEEMASAK